MFVRLLIGQQHGQIVDMPFHAAEAGLSAGSVAKVTDAELQAAGLADETKSSEAVPESMPNGYRAEPVPGGFDVFLGDGQESINDAVLPNLPAARSFAFAHAEKAGGRKKPARADEKDPGSVDIPADWRVLSWPQLRVLASQVSDDPIKTKADALGAVDRELARRAAAKTAAENAQNQTNDGESGRAGTGSGESGTGNAAGGNTLI